jgi:hypothetical protein
MQTIFILYPTKYRSARRAKYRSASARTTKYRSATKNMIQMENMIRMEHGFRKKERIWI